MGWKYYGNNNNNKYNNDNYLFLYSVTLVTLKVAVNHICTWCQIPCWQFCPINHFIQKSTFIFFSQTKSSFK